MSGNRQPYKSVPGIKRIGPDSGPFDLRVRANVNSLWQGNLAMSKVLLLSPYRMSSTKRFFPKSRGVPQGNDRRVISGTVYVRKNGLQWKDAPHEYGPDKTL